MKKLFLLLLFIFSASVFGQKVLKDKVVESGCGMCMYDVKSEKGCSMSVKIDGKVYPVEGIDKKHFGDAHAKDGYCSMKKKAKVSGKIKKGVFYATKFEYVR